MLTQMPIEKHPEYCTLLDKYAVRKEGTCPPEYIPCPNPEDFIKANLPIEKHPDYSKLMQKYALVNDSTDPPTYNPCKCPPCKALSEYDIKDHPDACKYVEKSKVQKLIGDVLESRDPELAKVVDKCLSFDTITTTTPTKTCCNGG